MKKILLSAAACAASLGIFSCVRETNGNLDSMGFSKSYVQTYVSVQELHFTPDAPAGYLAVVCLGEKYLYSDPARGMFKQLSEKYGDTCYNKRMVAFGTQALADEFVCIDVTSDKDFDPAHKAGQSLGDITRLVAVSPLKFIRSGYTGQYDWQHAEPADYAGTGIVRSGADHPVNKPLSELAPDDLLLLDPEEIYLKFTVRPQEKMHTLTVTFKNADKEVSGQTTVLFE